jgi:hypothetical protein
MRIVLSGEGPTDIGTVSYPEKTFEPGPMTYFIDMIVSEHSGRFPLMEYKNDGEAICYIEKSKLAQSKRSGKSVFPGKKNARALSIRAKEIASLTGVPTIAVLFRDADPTRSQDAYGKKWKSVMDGFEESEFHSGMPMIPYIGKESPMIILNTLYEEDTLNSRTRSNCRDGLGKQVNPL